MKMSKESYDLIAKVFSENKERIKYHRHRMREEEIMTNNIKNLEVWVAFDAYYVLISPIERRHIRESDNLKDAHIQTALLKALRECGI